MALGIVTLYEIEFKLQHDCPYNDLTRRHPDAVIAMWCNYGRHVMEISYKDVDLFERIQEDLQQLARAQGGRILRKAFSGTNLQVVLQTCDCAAVNQERPMVTPVVENHNCLQIEPTIYRGGWEWYRIMAFSQKDVKELFDALAKFCTLEIVSRRTIGAYSVRDALLISTSSLFAELTGKQSQALVAALERGYYRVPKKISTDEIAQQLRLPRTTYEEHLRKAESKVLRAVAPYIQLRDR